MKDDIYQQAKEIFFKYQGNPFFMEQDYLYKTFKNYNVPQNILTDWYKELLLKNKEKLLSTSNNEKMIGDFFLYLDLIRCNKNYFSTDDITFAFNFLRNNEKLDDFSRLLMIETIIDFIKYTNFSDSTIKDYCKNILSKMDIASFTVDDSYKYNGKLPSHALKENIAPRILKDLEQISLL
ncbi:hypothetical protein [Gilliamella sp. Pas-s25]|jgi:hypothetical protein|uniref:hypothetical protein n=1 Tax=Gilliamella sp. Pas-s25 TaxID=2687310 RepID=UPI00135D9F02|nr:hypothetical protein [Gilliamella sp. Pas-s25]MWP62526.1 hypothetical protein [Gilliamella sp. Pas-s25]